jgi:hypothetical protein
MKTAVAAICLSLAAIGLTAAHASYVVVDDTDFSYTGTVTDPAGTPTAIPSFTDNSGTYTGRDASIWASSGAPTSITGAGWENTTVFETAWYPTTTANGRGWGNPNNSDTGFFQLWDQGNTTITSATGHWNDALTQFTLNITASGAGAAQVARLWDAPNIGGAADDTAGTFEAFDLSLVATFASPATEELPGWYSTYATPTSITGSVTGTFLNQSPTAALNGLYLYDLTFQGQDWAKTVGASGTGPSYFGAAVPEPATLALFGAGLLGFAGLGALRRRKKAA